MTPSTFLCDKDDLMSDSTSGLALRALPALTSTDIEFLKHALIHNRVDNASPQWSTIRPSAAFLTDDEKEDLLLNQEDQALDEGECFEDCPRPTCYLRAKLAGETHDIMYEFETLFDSGADVNLISEEAAKLIPSALWEKVEPGWGVTTANGSCSRISRSVV
jgi:hypothetical protein